MQYLAAINPHGGIHEKFYTDPADAENFARAHDRPPNGVFGRISELTPDAARLGRRLPNVAAVPLIHSDIDVKDLMATRDEVHAKLMALPTPFEVRDSGYGFHVLAHLKAAALAGTIALERVSELRSRLTTVLAADRASLLRRLGTHNYKGDMPKLCHIIRPGIPISLDEAGAVIDSLGPDPFFGRGAIDAVLNPRRRTVRTDGEDDPFRLLEEMSYRGAVPINRTQLLVVKALLHDGVALWRTVRIVLRGTRDAVRGNPECTGWDWRKEEDQIASAAYRCVNRYPKLHAVLEPVHRVAWETLAAAGKTPRLIRTHNIGWVVDDAPAEVVTPGRRPTEDWLRRAVGDDAVTGNPVAVAYATLIFLDPAARTKGYFDEPMRRTLRRMKAAARTLIRARTLLVTRGHLQISRIGNSVRAVPCLPGGTTEEKK